MAGIDALNVVLAVIVFAVVFLPFLWWQREREAKRHAKEARDKALRDLRSRDC
jgi:hypothetical protein